MQRQESPCKGVCRLNERQVCIGCGRTLQEIAEWTSVSPEQREAICRAARARLLDIQRASGAARQAIPPGGDLEIEH